MLYVSYHHFVKPLDALPKQNSLGVNLPGLVKLQISVLFTYKWHSSPLSKKLKQSFVFDLVNLRMNIFLLCQYLHYYHRSFLCIIPRNYFCNYWNILINYGQNQRLQHFEYNHY